MTWQVFDQTIVAATAALDLAAEGREVALVSSGDPGIYAMASLVFELIERGARPDWRRLEIVIAPGISALQAAAARAGAPLGHDFCAGSLSDLMTPWPVIERRVRAAAEADFVIARSKLKRHFDDNAMPVREFATFEDVGRHLEEIRGVVGG